MASAATARPWSRTYPDSMTRSEAERHAQRLQAQDPDRDTCRFIARERAGAWDVVKLPIPAELRRGPYTETIAATPRPSPADDPRTGNEQRAPGLPGGV
jgi:hypothetical protein